MTKIEKYIQTHLINTARVGGTVTVQELAEDIGIDTSDTVDYLQRFKATGLINIGDQKLERFTAIQFRRLQCVGEAIYQPDLGLSAPTDKQQTKAAASQGADNTIELQFDEAPPKTQFAVGPCMYTLEARREEDGTVTLVIHEQFSPAGLKPGWTPVYLETGLEDETAVMKQWDQFLERRSVTWNYMQGDGPSVTYEIKDDPNAYPPYSVLVTYDDGNTYTRPDFESASDAWAWVYENATNDYKDQVGEEETVSRVAVVVDADLLVKCQNLLSAQSIRDGGKLLGTIELEGALYGVNRLKLGVDKSVLAAELITLVPDVEGPIFTKFKSKQVNYQAGVPMYVYLAGYELALAELQGVAPSEEAPAIVTTAGAEDLDVTEEEKAMADFDPHLPTDKDEAQAKADAEEEVTA